MAAIDVDGRRVRACLSAFSRIFVGSWQMARGTGTGRLNELKRYSFTFCIYLKRSTIIHAERFLQAVSISRNGISSMPQKYLARCQPSAAAAAALCTRVEPDPLMEGDKSIQFERKLALLLLPPYHITP
jgi:hypothetical protein